MTTMEVLLYSDWDTLKMSRSAIPEIGRDEVLLKVAACGLCGSELETFTNKSPRRPPPLVLGHEFCGEVVALGAEVLDTKVGDRKIVIPLVPCGDCPTCRRKSLHLCPNRQLFGMNRQGAFAEYVNVPQACLIEWPEGISAEEACLAEPLANGVHVVGLTKRFSPKKVLVVGAGPIGLMCQQAFQSLAHAEVLVADLNSERVSTAIALGAAMGIDAGTQDVVGLAKSFTEGEGVDVVVDAVGSPFTKTLSLQALRVGGAAVWIGLHGNEMNLNSYDITLPEKTVMGTYSAAFGDYDETLKLMRDNSVDLSSWVDSYRLDQGVEVFHRMLAAKGKDIKAVFTAAK